MISRLRAILDQLELPFGIAGRRCDRRQELLLTDMVEHDRSPEIPPAESTESLAG